MSGAIRTKRQTAVKKFDRLSGEMRRCKCCLVERPVEAFNIVNERGKKPRDNSWCMACNPSGSGKGPYHSKRAGAPQEVVEREANARFDIVRKKRGWPEFSLVEHLERKAAERLSEAQREAEIARAAQRAAEMLNSPAPTRADVRRARKAVEKKCDARRKQSEREARFERLALKRAKMSEVQLINDAVKRIVARMRGAKQRVAQNNEAIDKKLAPRAPAIPTRRKTWTLTPSEIKQIIIRSNLCCEVSGVPFDMSDVDIFRPRHPLSPSIDQISPGAGYTFKNARLVAYMFNVGKNDTTQEEAEVAWLRIADGIRERRLARANGGSNVAKSAQ